MPARSSLLVFLLLLLLFAVQPSWAQASSTVQDTLNRVDEMGRKQGYWKIVAPKAEKPGYTNGQLIEEGRYANSKRIGLWRSFWPNGKVKSEITYVSGRPRGEYTIYYPNGKTEESGTWDLDRNTGKFRRWHANGELAQEFVFDETGLRDGQQKYFHENGQLAVDVKVEDGKEQGTMKRYYANGDVQQVAQFNDGVINPANSKFIKPVHKATPTAPAAEAKPAPAVTQEESTNASLFKENGFNTLYDKQLRISQQGVFRNGRLWNGKYLRYNKDGILSRIEVYEGGRYIGDRPITDEDLQ